MTGDEQKRVRAVVTKPRPYFHGGCKVEAVFLGDKLVINVRHDTPVMGHGDPGEHDSLCSIIEVEFLRERG